MTTKDLAPLQPNRLIVPVLATYLLGGLILLAIVALLAAVL